MFMGVDINKTVKHVPNDKKSQPPGDIGYPRLSFIPNSLRYQFRNYFSIQIYSSFITGKLPDDFN